MEQIVYAVTGHTEYEDFSYIAGIFTEKDIAEAYKNELEQIEFGSFSYYQLEEIVLNERQIIPPAPPPIIHKILLKREENWEEPFRIEYDGKYITLFGKDKNYVVPDYGGHGQIEYEQMVLVPVVEEIRNIIPKYANCDKNDIEIGYILKVEE
jgi:hypothetical protein